MQELKGQPPGVAEGDSGRSPQSGEMFVEHVAVGPNVTVH